jgi:hypothetical protein
MNTEFEMIEMYRLGLSTAAIGRCVGLSQRQVRRILSRDPVSAERMRDRSSTGFRGMPGAPDLLVEVTLASEPAGQDLAFLGAHPAAFATSPDKNEQNLRTVIAWRRAAIAWHSGYDDAIGGNGANADPASPYAPIYAAGYDAGLGAAARLAAVAADVRACD